MTTAFFAASSALLMAAALGACSSSALSDIQCPVPLGATPAQILDAKRACYGCTTDVRIDPRTHRDLDILFVIDNSPSMAPKQKALGAALPKFMANIKSISDAYHIGIVTTDLGINVADGTATGVPFPPPIIPACNTAAGDDGVLQNVVCPDRAGLTGESAFACASSCPNPRYVPAHGGRYISSSDGITNVPQLMVNGLDVGPDKSFQCMALVGAAGCAVSQPLEAARRALDNHRVDNAGFNRGTSALAVVFITDKDDMSVQQAQRGLLNPATPGETSPACNTPAQSVDPQCYNLGYRGLALDLQCLQPMNAAGAKTACIERANSLLTPIDQYVNFFRSLPNPNIFLVGIWPPSILDNPSSDPAQAGQLFVDFASGTLDSAQLAAGLGSHAACTNPDPMLTASPQGFFGQSQLRLSTFSRSLQKSNFTELSICDVNNYADALAALPSNFASAFGIDCLRSVPRMANGVPECVVGYVDATTPAGTPDVALPVCSSTCCDYFATNVHPSALPAKVAACSADPDCYCAVPNLVACGDGAVAAVWRQGNAAPPSGKVVSFQCAGPIGC